MDNLYTVLFLVPSIARTGDFVENTQTIVASGPLMLDIILMSLGLAGGQIFAFSLMSQFGPVMMAVVMTVRQVISILLSSWVYAHYLSPVAVTCVVALFTAVFANIAIKRSLDHKTC